MKIEYPPDATPLPLEWEKDLIPRLETMGELNEFEQQNILEALRWGRRQRRFRKELLTVDGLRTLHGRMFDTVWRWAGQFRQRNLNLGIEWGYVPIELKQLCGDAAYWSEHQTYDWVELAVRFHHRLVSIHPFYNGNGRHARLAADLLLHYNGHAMLPWGRADLGAAGEVRRAYIEALRAADRGDVGPLLELARSGGSGWR